MSLTHSSLSPATQNLPRLRRESLLQMTKKPMRARDRLRASQQQGAKIGTRHGWQRRIDRITRQRGEAERRAEDAERELAAIKYGKTSTVGINGENEPDIENFETWDAYDAAKKEWDKKQAQKPAEKSPEQQTAKPQGGVSQELQDALEDMAPSFDAARKTHTDFDEVMNGDGLHISESVAILVADTENPGEVAYWLGTHKDEAARISGLSALKQARELSLIEAKLNEAPPQKRSTKAPPPISPLTGNESVSPGYHPGMTQADFEEWDANQKRPSSNGWI